MARGSIAGEVHQACEGPADDPPELILVADDGMAGEIQAQRFLLAQQPLFLVPFRVRRGFACA